MANLADVCREIDRLITQGHQDSSLLTALERTFPDLTQVELEAGFVKVVADRNRQIVIKQE